MLASTDTSSNELDLASVRRSYLAHLMELEFKSDRTFTKDAQVIMIECDGKGLTFY